MITKSVLALSGNLNAQDITYHKTWYDGISNAAVNKAWMVDYCADTLEAIEPFATNTYTPYTIAMLDCKLKASATGCAKVFGT